jgi:hypothetical protein
MRRLTATLAFVAALLAAVLLPATANAASMVEYATAATAIEYGLIVA